MEHLEIGSRLYMDDGVVEAFEKQAVKDFFDARQPQCRIVDDAVVLPAQKFADGDGKAFFRGGVIDDNGNFVVQSQHVRNTHDGAMLEGYDCPDEVVFENKEVLYGGVLMQHFGHFLLETTNRLWYWIENRDKNLDIVFLPLKHSKKVLPQFWEFMDLLGIARDKIHFLREPKRFSKVYVPEASGVISVSFNEKFLLPFQEIASRVEPKDKKKIYLSRTKFTKGSHCLGEEHIEKVFGLNGYHVVYPERLSLREQIEYIRGADEVAGVIGTATHLELFAKPRVKSIICERSDVPLSAQMLVHQAIGADWYDIGAEMNPFPVDHSTGPILLGVTESFARFGRKYGWNIPSELVGYVKKEHSKAWVKEYFRRYCQKTYNERLAVVAPLVARRLSYMSSAFVPLKKRFKHLFQSLFRKI